MITLPLLELKELVSNDFQISDSLYSTYALTVADGSAKFASVLKKVLKQYGAREAPYREQSAQASIVSGPILFTDNFDQYIAGTITEDQVQLIPTTVVWVKSGFDYISAQTWRYQKPTLNLYTVISNMTIGYFHDYKYNIEYDPTGEFSLASCIYFIDSNEVNFLSLFEYELCKMISSTAKSGPDASADIFPWLDTKISELESIINSNVDLTLMNMWRK